MCCRRGSPGANRLILLLKSCSNVYRNLFHILSLLQKKINSWQRPTLPRLRAVPSALEGLTAVFGMGTGVSPPLLSPGNLITYLVYV
mgnify:CR=1 FL=1